MKRFKSFTIILLITALLSVFLETGVAASMLKALSFIEDSTLTNSFYRAQMITLILYVLKLIILLPMAIWIFRDSVKELYLPWAWAIVVLGLNFKGLILYLLVQVLSNNRKDG